MQRVGRIELAVPRPGWLTAGALRLGALSVFIVLVAMLRPRLTPYAAGWVVLGAGIVMVAGALGFAATTRRVARLLPIPGRAQQLTEATFLLLRRLGLPLLGLAFFLLWAFVYMAVWWAHPHDAFRGLEAHPRFADFFYTSVSTAFISPPGDIVAHSRGARAATIIEMLTAFAFVTAYASSFLDLRRSEPAGPEDLAAQAVAEPD